MTNLHGRLYFHHCGFRDLNDFNKIRYTIKKKKALREKSKTLKRKIDAALEKNPTSFSKGFHSLP